MEKAKLFGRAGAAQAPNIHKVIVFHISQKFLTFLTNDNHRKMVNAEAADIDQNESFFK